MPRHLFLVVILVFGLACEARAEHDKKSLYAVGHLKPVDSVLTVAVGDPAPDFTLPAVNGGTVTLSAFKGKSNVVISFVPAAWTPVCSDQWPGYNFALELFEQNNAQIIGITVDNIPSLHAWTHAMAENGMDFPVLSDFWPHGHVAREYGVLRSDGLSERALFIIDRQGTITYADVHDINQRPDLGILIRELEKLR